MSSSSLTKKLKTYQFLTNLIVYYTFLFVNHTSYHFFLSTTLITFIFSIKLSFFLLILINFTFNSFFCCTCVLNFIKLLKFLNIFLYCLYKVLCFFHLFLVCKSPFGIFFFRFNFLVKI